jgi:hypothetical protein
LASWPGDTLGMSKVLYNYDDLSTSYNGTAANLSLLIDTHHVLTHLCMCRLTMRSFLVMAGLRSRLRQTSVSR